MPSPSKDLIILILGRALQVVALFLNYKLMVHFLPQDQVGLYFLILSIASYFGLVMVNPIGVYLNRRIHSWEKEKTVGPSISFFGCYCLLVSLLSFPLCMILSGWVDFGTLSVGLIGSLLAFYIFSANIGNSFVPALNILNHRVSFVVLTVLIHFVGLAFSIFLTTKVQESASYWLTGLALGYFLFGALGFLLLFRYTQSSLALSSIKETLKGFEIKTLLKFALPLVLTNICLWLVTQSYRPLSERYVGLEYLGLAGLGLGLASTISVTFEYLLQQFHFPKFYEGIQSKDQAHREESWNSYANQVLPVYISIGFFVSLLSPFIVRILANEEYIATFYFLGLGIWAEMLRASSNVLSLIGQSEMNTKRTIIPYVLGALLTLAMLHMGYLTGTFMKGLPIYLIIGNLIVCIALFYSFRKQFKISLEWRNLIKRTGHVLVFFLAAAFYSFVDSFLASFAITGLFGLFFLWVQYPHIKELETRG